MSAKPGKQPVLSQIRNLVSAKMSVPTFNNLPTGHQPVYKQPSPDHEPRQPGSFRYRQSY